MKLRNKKTGEIGEAYWVTFREDGTDLCVSLHKNGTYEEVHSLAELNEDWEDYKPKEPLIKDEKTRKAVRAWAEAENCSSEMNLYYMLNRQEKYITFHNPQTGSELQLCDFDSPVFQEMREYTIAELCGEEEG